MELTNPQLYALFGAAIAVLILIGITYCAGLSTGESAGYEQGRMAATDHWRRICSETRAELTSSLQRLDSREREIKTLRRNIQAEADDHDQVERGLLQRLAAAAPLGDEDQATLEAIANKLELAADTWQAFPTGGDHARYARQLAQLAHNMAQRLKTASANTLPHPDSELIDWLEGGIEQWWNEETHYLAIPYDDAAIENGNLRQALRELMKREAFDVETATRFFRQHHAEAAA